MRAPPIVCFPIKPLHDFEEFYELRTLDQTLPESWLRITVTLEIYYAVPFRLRLTWGNKRSFGTRNPQGTTIYSNCSHEWAISTARQ